METQDAIDTLDDELDAALASHLASCGRSGGYRVEETLKRSDFEVTEKVFFAGEGGGELGPFVRKRIDASCGLGRAYARLRDAQLRGLRCPNLPRIVDCWNDGRDLNVVMEWICGPTLEELVRAEGPSEALAREVAAQLACALGQLHGGLGGGAPIIHRDLKPSNVMVAGGAAGVPRTFVLIDLGIARTWREGAAADTVRLGTRSYAPPEQFGFGQTSVRSDVYALGAVLGFCLTGEDPGETPGEIDPERFPNVPDDLRRVVKKAMSFDPAARFADAAGLARAVAGKKGRPAGGVGAEDGAAGDESADGMVGATGRAAGAGTVAPSPRRPRFRLPQVPARVGKAWNGLLCAAVAILTAACLWSVGEPVGLSAGYPLWFRVLEFVVWMPGTFVLAALLLADKRRLRFHVRPLACVGGMLALMIATLAVGMAAGII